MGKTSIGLITLLFPLTFANMEDREPKYVYDAVICYRDSKPLMILNLPSRLDWRKDMKTSIDYVTFPCEKLGTQRITRDIVSIEQLRREAGTPVGWPPDKIANVVVVQYHYLVDP